MWPIISKQKMIVYMQEVEKMVNKDFGKELLDKITELQKKKGLKDMELSTKANFCEDYLKRRRERGSLTIQGATSLAEALDAEIFLQIKPKKEMKNSEKYTFESLGLDSNALIHPDIAPECPECGDTNPYLVIDENAGYTLNDILYSFYEVCMDESEKSLILFKPINENWGIAIDNAWWDQTRPDGCGIYHLNEDANKDTLKITIDALNKECMKPIECCVMMIEDEPGLWTIK